MQVTLKHRDIEILHLEPTDVCQAACPACDRELSQDFDADKHHHLTIDQIKDCLTLPQLQKLNKMYMCGVYGDPAAGKNTLEIYQWLREINPGITLGMNSNGGLQNVTWWRRLAKLLQQPKDYVVFSIDGLEDTNKIYRRGVDWNKLITNVQAFIAAGGRAHWDMLVYRHNEHQIDRCQQLAKDMGFTWFRVKVSSRPLVANLQAPIMWQRPNIQSQEIKCQALAEQSLYIDAQGRVIPCCWLATEARKYYLDLDKIQQSWYTKDPHSICAKTCGSKYNANNFTSQWQREVEFLV